MPDPKRMTLGIVTIVVVMFFAAAATDIFWIGRLAGGLFPSTMGVEDRFYNAFAAPDLVLSILLYAGAYGLLKLRKFGLVAAYLAMGMWLFDCLLVLAITRLSRITMVGFSLLFIIFTAVYLWTKRDLFS